MLPHDDEQLLAPLMVPVSTTVQVYAVPPAVLVSATLGAPPLHIDAVAGVAVTTGIGLTVITTDAVAVQVLAVPVIVYVAVPAVLLLLLVNVWAIVLPHDEAQLLAPLIVPVCTSVQVYVVPPALLVKAMLGAVPLQMDADGGVAVIAGAGLTVIVAVADAVHVLAVPIIV